MTDWFLYGVVAQPLCERRGAGEGVSTGFHVFASMSTIDHVPSS